MIGDDRPFPSIRRASGERLLAFSLKDVYIGIEE
jgi:hypothetical protein